MTSRQVRGDRKVNLLIVTTGLHVGGAEMVVRDLVRSIDRDRFHVSVCCLKALGSVGEELRKQGIDISVLPESVDGRVDYLSFLKLRKVIKAKCIDVVHTHTTYAFADACLCRLTLPGLRLVHTFHFGNYPHRVRTTLYMEAVCSRIADRLVAVGEVQRRQIRSVYRLADARIGTVWNGVQPASDSGSRDFRARICSDDVVLVGTLSNFKEQKGLPYLLQVARRLRDTGTKVRFVVAGDGHLRPELERMRREFDLDDDVVFVGWSTDAASTVLPAVDIYFQPSLWEAMSIAILEAMSVGKPVVATRVGEAPYMISDGEDGVLVEPRDVAGMTSAIAKLVDDPGLRLRLGEAAAHKAAKTFSVDRMARAYESVYLGLLEQNIGN